MNIKQLSLKIIRSLYRMIPFSRETRDQVTSTLYENFPGLFGGTSGYEWWLSKRIIHHAQFPVRTIGIPTRTLQPDVQFTLRSSPTVSIIIPVYGNIEYTVNCLNSIYKSQAVVEFEIVIIDDNSPDETFSVLSGVSGIVLIRNEENLGYLRSCNKAAAVCKGKYLALLNNDTYVLPGWLDALYDTIERDPSVGLVGSKLLHPDGHLLEAGSLVFRDGSAMNIGRGSDPNKPEFNHVREVDYCSAASILVRTALFDEIGGFDERFVPAYYEDTDLALALSSNGYKILYQPQSAVFHYEGVTCGTDENKGVKHHQVLNREKFHGKWETRLETEPKYATHDIVSRELLAPTALVVDWSTPRPDRDSGSIDTINYIKMLVQLGFIVKFYPDDNKYDPVYTRNLQDLGVECLYSPFTKNLTDYLSTAGLNFKLAMLNRAPFAHKHIDTIRTHCSDAKIIFNTVDLHFIREQRQKIYAPEDHSPSVTKEFELEVMRKSDATIAISVVEENIILAECGSINVVHIPYIREGFVAATSFHERKDIAFIGGYDFAPNVDAVKHFCTQIWPLIHNELEGSSFLIVGSNVSPEIEALELVPGVRVVGYVEDLRQVLDTCRLTVAPLRFGAGIKGKIGSSLSHGVPCVATSLAIEGLDLVHGETILVADQPHDFTKLVVQLYTNEELWTTVSRQGLQHFNRHYSHDAAFGKFSNLVNNLMKAV